MCKKVFENPGRAKVAFIVTLIFAILFLVGTSVLGYFYWSAEQSKTKLDERVSELEEQGTSSKATLEKQVADLITENERVDKENISLEKTITDQGAKIKVVLAYNEVLRYMTLLIERHGGLTGLSETEYQTGLQKARLTGNQAFVNTVEWAWHRTDISPVTRSVAVWNGIVSGIANALK